MYVCAAMHIAKNQRNEVFKTYLQFHKIPTKKKKQYYWVWINKTERKIKVKLNKDNSSVIQQWNFPLCFHGHTHHIKCKI